MIELLNNKKTDVKKLENQLKICEDSFESLPKGAKKLKLKNIWKAKVHVLNLI